MVYSFKLIKVLMMSQHPSSKNQQKPNQSEVVPAI